MTARLLIRNGLAIALIGNLFLCGMAIAQQHLVGRYEALAQMPAAVALAEMAATPSVQARSLPPRALVNRALAETRAAVAAVDDGTRSRLLALAGSDLSRLANVRPNWGDLRVASTFHDTMVHGIFSDVALANFARSYRDAPYLDDSAPWRFRYAIATWGHLSAGTRQAVINEAVWFAHRSLRNRDIVNTILGESEPGVRFVIERRRYRMIQSAEDIDSGDPGGS